MSNKTCKNQFERPNLPGMPVRTQSCRETDAATDAHSPATGGTQDISHWGQSSPLHAHTGQQTCGQSLATLAHKALENPAKMKQRHFSQLFANYRDKQDIQ